MSFSKNGAKANEEYVRFIHRLADESAKVIKPYFAALNFEVEIKEDETPVTLADRQAEALMRDLIRREFPNHGIIGEEYGSENEGAEFVWILDPIDGTISFASGCPLFGTLICLLHEDRPILGAINQPILDILCLGDNHRTSVNGTPRSDENSCRTPRGDPADDGRSEHFRIPRRGELWAVVS